MIRDQQEGEKLGKVRLFSLGTAAFRGGFLSQSSRRLDGAFANSFVVFNSVNSVPGR